MSERERSAGGRFCQGGIPSEGNNSFCSISLSSAAIYLAADLVTCFFHNSQFLPLWSRPSVCFFCIYAGPPDELPYQSLAGCFGTTKSAGEWARLHLCTKGNERVFKIESDNERKLYARQQSSLFSLVVLLTSRSSSNGRWYASTRLILSAENKPARQTLQTPASEPVYFDSGERIKMIFVKKSQLAKAGEELSLNVGSETQLWRHNNVESMLFLFFFFFFYPSPVVMPGMSKSVKKKKKFIDKGSHKRKRWERKSIERTIP